MATTSSKLSVSFPAQGLNQLEGSCVARCSCQSFPTKKVCRDSRYFLKLRWSRSLHQRSLDIGQSCRQRSGIGRGALFCRAVLEAPSVETVEKEVKEYSGHSNGELGNKILHSKEIVAVVSNEGGESSETPEEQKAREEETARRKLAADIAAEVAKRRNFAIISHPDAGKTTLVSALFPSVTASTLTALFPQMHLSIVQVQRSLQYVENFLLRACCRLQEHAMIVLVNFPLQSSSAQILSGFVTSFLGF
jgi:hypothetical protein